MMPDDDEVQRLDLQRSERAGGTIFGIWGRRIILAMILLSAAGTVGSVVWGARFVTPRAHTSDSYGAGPLGHLAFVETLEELGYHVLQNRGSGFERPRGPVLFLEPNGMARVDGIEFELADVIERRRLAGLPSVVVLPKWTFPVGLGTGIAERVSARETRAALDAVFPEARYGQDKRGDVQSTSLSYERLSGVSGEFSVTVPELQVVDHLPSGVEVLLDTSEGAVVLRADGVLLVSDPDFLHTFNFHRADHAVLWASILSSYQSDVIVVDEVFHGHGTSLSLREAVGEFPTVLILVQALVVLSILFLLGTRRFGPPLPLRPIGRGPEQAIAVAAGVLSDGQPLGRLVFNYTVAIITETHRALGFEDGVTIDQQAQRIDRQAERNGVAAEMLRALQAARAKQAERIGSKETWKPALSAYRVRTELLASGKKPSAPKASSDTVKPPDPVIALAKDEPYTSQHTDS